MVFRFNGKRSLFRCVLCDVVMVGRRVGVNAARKSICKGGGGRLLGGLIVQRVSLSFCKEGMIHKRHLGYGMCMKLPLHYPGLWKMISVS